MLIENPLSSSPLVFPILDCFHIAGFALAIGTTALIDFRLLDLGLRHLTAAQVARNVSWWMLGGLTVAVFTGLMLFSTDPDMYYLNWSFVAKMVCLVAAVVFNYTVLRKAAASGFSPSTGRLVACISLVLWIAVIFGGIFIAFI